MPPTPPDVHRPLGSPSRVVPSAAASSAASLVSASAPPISAASTIEIIPGRLYYTTSTRAPSYGVDVVDSDGSVSHYFSTDHSLVYWNFFLDFGPLNLGQTYRFCEALDAKLADPRVDRVVYYSAGLGQRQANSACLLGAYAILRLGRCAEDAYAPFRGLRLPPFHDATQGVCTYKLTVLDCLRGLERAVRLGFFDYASFDVDEYEHFEKVESGDLSWIFPGRFLAFAGPHETKSYDEVYPTCVPEDYHDYFLKKNVRTVVRLNKRYYDENRFKAVGIHHEELYYPDGSCPSDDVLARFLEICEARTDHAVAVHCKAGLGRTGTCIGAFAMKHWGFTAAEVIGWMRIARPGSVIGPQQHYLEAIEPRMHAAGGHVRRAEVLALTAAPVPLPTRDVSVPSIASSASSNSTVASSADEGEEETRDGATQGDHLLSAKLSSPGAPKTRHTLAHADASSSASASTGGSGGGGGFASFRTVVSRRWYGSSSSSSSLTAGTGSSGGVGGSSSKA